MSKIIFSKDLIKYMSLFQTVTRTGLKDCIQDDSQLIFIVNQGDIGRAVGRKAANVKRLEKLLNRKIKILEFNSEISQFIRNVVYPLKVSDIQGENGVYTLQPEDKTARGLLIGRNAQNLRFFERIVKRYFDLTELKVI